MSLLLTDMCNARVEVEGKSIYFSGIRTGIFFHFAWIRTEQSYQVFIYILYLVNVVVVFFSNSLSIDFTENLHTLLNILRTHTFERFHSFFWSILSFIICNQNLIRMELIRIQCNSISFFSCLKFLGKKFCNNSTHNKNSIDKFHVLFFHLLFIYFCSKTLKFAGWSHYFSLYIFSYFVFEISARK